ncbi:hypothetical protein KKE54_06330 [bacterium]|nr:hypothetical protein [bacterium]
MSRPYAKKARLIDDITRIEQYRPIMEKDNFQSDEPHWRRISKNTISLFQVLIDQDLSDLVRVLEHYPRYVEWVCEHFRYAYSYSENAADIDAASQLLFMGEAYFSKQFVRNVVRKLPKLDDMDIEALGRFGVLIGECRHSWHPIVTNHYHDLFTEGLARLDLHPLQRIALNRPIAGLKRQETYEYDAEDRDAVLDIPYMT